MAKRFNGAVNFANAFSYSSAVPMDDRLIVNAVEDLTVANNWKKNGVYFAYQGMPVTIATTGEMYVFTKEADDETIVDSASWHCITGDSIDDDWEELVDETSENEENTEEQS